jgi:hypothetical protein
MGYCCIYCARVFSHSNSIGTALVWMVVTTFKLDGGAAAMLIPSVLAAIISVAMNFMIFWNRLGTREQRKALNAMGLA